MNATTQKITRFGLLTALALVLGLMDRAIPLSMLLGGAAPGIKLGLANTVLLYAVYLMDGWSAFGLMLVKVALSGFIYGSLTAILYSMAGGILSLGIMLAVRRRAGFAALAAGILAVGSDICILIRNPSPKGQLLLAVILIGLGAVSCLTAYYMIRKGKIQDIPGTSVAGAVAHNIGQVLVYALTIADTPSMPVIFPILMTVYLPVLIGIGAVVGSLTGVIAERVFKAMRLKPIKE